jgi:hypothetical protein
MVGLAAGARQCLQGGIKMNGNTTGKLAGWAALAAVAVLAAMMSLGRAGLPEAEPLPLGTRCEAPQTPPPAKHAVLQGQIRYDSGVVLRYCSLAAMFAQLSAQEQPGVVRSAVVRSASGRWLGASRARYLEQGRAVPVLLAYPAGGGAAAPAGGRWLTYHQLLQACGRGACPQDGQRLVTKD